MYFRKKSTEDIPLENTAIWSCENESCMGWMRDNFAFESAPVCSSCQAPMVSGMRMLPMLSNTNSNFKSLKKGVQIS
ncbi:cold-shock protein [Paenibacillus periandrae]|uniref:cold-shock protein n=1 Tax=Paenibacillus periandrae TaxID=1761741 RepID=UPI001F09D6FC|nr:cold-shock protein [Paenibacillus periandrae]